MRTRQKVTAVGAVALASAAIGGGALFTSHAMAADPTPPATGTLVIISRSAGSDRPSSARTTMSTCRPCGPAPPT